MPRADLSVALGVVEERAQTLDWCPRPEQCERAGLECSLIAAAELAELLDLMEIRLSRYQRDWNRETEKGSLKTGGSFLEMAEGAYAAMHQSYWRSVETRRICAVVEGLRNHWSLAEQMLDRFREGVLEVLRERSATRDGQEKAVEALAEINSVVKRVREQLSKWRDEAKSEVTRLHSAVRGTQG